MSAANLPAGVKLCIAVLSAILIGQLPCRAQSLCTGYDSQTGSWAMTTVSPAQVESYCPDGQAMMALAGLSRNSWTPLMGSCCPLPAGSLLDKHLFVVDSCPDGYVVTGGRLVGLDPLTAKPPGLQEYLQLRCTAIDPAVVRLSVRAQPAVVVPVPSFVELLWTLAGRGITRVSRGMIPPHLRYGLGRINRTIWLDSVCLALPWGAVLTGVADPNCEAAEFRTLTAGEPSSAAELQSEPCRYVADVFSPDAKCVP